MPDYVMELREVSKKFDKSPRFAVRDVNLKISSGSFMTIVGSSGSGKTTLLKMLNRIYEPTSGEIIFEGQNVNKLRAEDYRKRIGYVIQQIGLFPHMTVMQNIAAVPRSLKWDRKRIDERVDYLLEMMHMEPGVYRNRYPAQLSGGQQQRVGIARAMAADPSVMLMDEPFGAIDTITRKSLQDEIMSIQKRLSKTIMFVTHDIHEAFKLGDNVIIMDDGVIQQCGTPFDTIFHPASEYVSRLISSENILEKLQVLHAGAVMEPVSEKSNSDDAVRVRYDEPLSSVLGRFVEEGVSYVSVIDGEGKEVGEIWWNKFNRISKLNREKI
ncbi:MAG: ABC transporter ATP-binding protein [Synergistaceae bacterium]|jgi:osmoprotectant transport system ATP-binding protein|nr:ABC transporter ATP-binding protein [Synergistaceae bacterium]